MIQQMTLLDGILAGFSTLSATGAGALLWARVRRPVLREYTPPKQKLGEPVRYEFLRESNGQFLPTGELVPLGNPHEAIAARQARDGVAYAARMVVNPRAAKRDGAP